MLDYRLLGNKATISLKDRLNDNIETKCKDLLSMTFNENISMYGYPLIVNHWYIGRPDLIALAVYGDDKYADVICKVNGISNPFELNENDLLIIPPIEYVNDVIQSQVNEVSDVIVSNSSKIVENKNQYQKELNQRRSSNEQIVGDSNYIIDRSLGLIFY